MKLHNNITSRAEIESNAYSIKRLNKVPRNKYSPACA